jgi:hypothetical protein
MEIPNGRVGRQSCNRGRNSAYLPVPRGAFHWVLGGLTNLPNMLHLVHCTEGKSRVNLRSASRWHWRDLTLVICR